ncbi:MAG: efflux RND transporter periplasmic adaptor subunit [Dysgonamonadaceae bacterium]|jgi:Cu(I)/Ag(I) efflux system membrane fusion protein|nr:efflux RND transporter periplasmic adaptor subunit [Dysgonamonadaceae bacterium]
MKQFIFFSLILGLGLTAGCKNSSSKSDEQHEHQIWTCSMHPQIRQDKPGKCPLCAMDLIPLHNGDAINHAPADAGAITLSEEAAALANIQTTIVGANHDSPQREIRLYGTIQSDQRRLHSQTAHVSGRIEKLSVNFEGEAIRAGQTVAQIYSSDLLNAQQELLQAKKLENPSLLNAAREKLRQWKLTGTQIANIEKSGTASPIVDITATSSGIVTAKKVEQGDYITPGAVLFDVADLSSVWAVFEAYETDLPYLKTGDKITYTLQALPGKTFSGKIAFIDPILDKTTRTAKIRVETANPNLQLKPGMIANATVQAALPQSGNAVIIPQTAVLWTGKRSIVYVKDKEQSMPAFRLREIELGSSLSNAYVVLSGLKEGEEIVTNGAFSIDASAQLEGKPSMMNHEPAATATAVETLHARSLHAGGACEMCQERIETAAKSIKGVKSVHWDAETQKLHLTYDSKKVTLNTVGQAIAKAGHDNEYATAGDAIYNALPPCCKYRDRQ